MKNRSARSRGIPGAGCILGPVVTLRVSNQGDVQSMDPHLLNESLQLSFTGNVYESLVERDKTMDPRPRSLQSGHSRRRRYGTSTFARGSNSTTERRSRRTTLSSPSSASGDGSDMKGVTNPIVEVRKVGDYAVEIETTAPYPILPDTLTTLAMMSKKWCEDNKAERPVDRRKGIENTASFKANGIGPWRLRERQPSVRTVLVRNFNYWGKIESNIDEVVFTPIGNDGTRVAALLSGETDLMEPPCSPAGRRTNQVSRRLHGPAGSRTAHDLPRHGPEARRAAVQQRQREESVQGRAYGARSTRRSTRRRSRTR